MYVCVCVCAYMGHMNGLHWAFLMCERVGGVVEFGTQWLNQSSLADTHTLPAEHRAIIAAGAASKEFIKQSQWL